MIFGKDLIRKLVKAIGVNEGEIVLLHFWGKDDDLTLLHDFANEIVAIGASPIKLQQSRTVNAELFRNAKASCFGESYFKQFDQIDTVIDIFMYQPVVLKEKLDDEHMNIYRQYMRNIFSSLMKAKKFVQLRVPTDENAEGTSLEPEIFKERMLKAYDIDYDILKANCEEKISHVKNSKAVIIKTSNTDQLSLSLEDRDWLIDAGDGDLPCGEISIAPVEGVAEGSVYFEKLYAEDAGIYYDIRLIIQNGHLVSSSNEDFNNFLNLLPDNGNVICEFGIGMNPNITELIGYTVLDEKMTGTFHIAIGDNTIFGGKNSAALHMDFVGRGELLFN